MFNFLLSVLLSQFQEMNQDKDQDDRVIRDNANRTSLIRHKNRKRTSLHTALTWRDV